MSPRASGILGSQGSERVEVAARRVEVAAARVAAEDPVTWAATRRRAVDSPELATTGSNPEREQSPAPHPAHHGASRLVPRVNPSRFTPFPLRRHNIVCVHSGLLSCARGLLFLSLLEGACAGLF